jgi:hypothetical protein
MMLIGGNDVDCVHWKAWSTAEGMVDSPAAPDAILGVRGARKFITLSASGGKMAKPGRFATGLAR